MNPIHRKTKRYAKATKVITIDDARNTVLKVKQLEGLSKNTLENYEKLFNDFDRFFGEKTDIRSLTFEDARNFVYWQMNDKVQFLKHKNRKTKNKGLKPSSVNTYLALAKGSFTVLVEEGTVETNIFKNLNSVKNKEKRIETLTIDEIRRLLKSLNKAVYSEFREYVVINVLLDTFGRITEVLSLRVEDIDFEHYSVTFQNTKNGKFRIVPISKKTVKLFKELIEENEDFESDYVFLTNHGKPLTSDTFRKHLREIVSRTGIEKKITPHLFRHTASEMFLRQNGSLRVLQKILGHHDLSVTSIYAHVLDSTIKQQHENFSPLNLIEEKVTRKTKRKGYLKE